MNLTGFGQAPLPPDSKGKRIAILQPGYIPWLGFFEQLSVCDIFVFLDDVQFTKNDWRNRNRIKTKEGIVWLTVPVVHKFGQKIMEVRIDSRSSWQRKHLQSFRLWYGRSRYFEEMAADVERIYSKAWHYLVDLDLELCLLLKDRFDIRSTVLRSSDLHVGSEDKNRRLIELCKATGCDHFYEGKSGQSYIDLELFRSHDITVEFQDYHHPYYDQLWMKEQGFISHLSAMDLLFNHGSDSAGILTGRKTVPHPEGVQIRHADMLLRTEGEKR
ncbi:MAG: WbqC family protein [Nitrospirae bacterium]|nr:WbqC family protein [Nitrospirota bacterium]